MKKIILFPAILSLVACTKSPTDTAKEKIREYVQKNFNDPSSYENIEYSKLDTVVELSDTERYNQYHEDSLMLDINISLSASIDSVFNTNTRNSDNVMLEKERLEKEWESLKMLPKIKYYSMTDKCRSKNKMGALNLEKFIYKFDTLLNIISCEQTR